VSEVIRLPPPAAPDPHELKRLLSEARARAIAAERRLAFRERELRDVLARHRQPLQQEPPSCPGTARR
jgi:hypothetical protein